MSARKSAVDSYYHVFNRGVDKRVIFPSQVDIERFAECMVAFNTENPIGSLFELRFQKFTKNKKSKKLVDIVCFCLNPNHFHFLLRQNSEMGMSEFMKRLSSGYTQYFNRKYGRSGVLFQGKYKSTLITTNEQLLHVSVYINLNNKVHRLGNQIIKSSWDEFSSGKDGMCSKNIILSQFDDPSEYCEFAKASLLDILERKDSDKELRTALLE